MTSLRRFILNLANNVVSKNKDSRPLTVIVEGNIGSGKTTFLNFFKKYKQIKVLAEPIELWRNCNGHNLLGHMYTDPKQWALTFQSYVQLTMLNHHTLHTECQVKMMERSIYSARYCFVESMVRNGILNKPSAAVIDAWFQWLIKNTAVEVDHIIYLRTQPEIVYERMVKRNRWEEKSITLDFLKDLHQLHEEWLYDKVLYHCPATVSVIDANLDIHSIEQECEKLNEMTFNLKKIVL